MGSDVDEGWQCVENKKSKKKYKEEPNSEKTCNNQFNKEERTEQEVKKITKELKNTLRTNASERKQFPRKPHTDWQEHKPLHSTFKECSRKSLQEWPKLKLTSLGSRREYSTSQHIFCDRSNVVPTPSGRENVETGESQNDTNFLYSLKCLTVSGPSVHKEVLTKQRNTEEDNDSVTHCSEGIREVLLCSNADSAAQAFSKPVEDQQEILEYQWKNRSEILKKTVLRSFDAKPPRDKSDDKCPHAQGAVSVKSRPKLSVEFINKHILPIQKTLKTQVQNINKVKGKKNEGSISQIVTFQDTCKNASHLYNQVSKQPVSTVDLAQGISGTTSHHKKGKEGCEATPVMKYNILAETETSLLRECGIKMKEGWSSSDKFPQCSSINIKKPHNEGSKELNFLDDQKNFKMPNPSQDRESHLTIVSTKSEERKINVHATSCGVKESAEGSEKQPPQEIVSVEGISLRNKSKKASEDSTKMLNKSGSVVTKGKLLDEDFPDLSSTAAFKYSLKKSFQLGGTHCVNHSVISDTLSGTVVPSNCFIATTIKARKKQPKSSDPVLLKFTDILKCTSTVCKRQKQRKPKRSDLGHVGGNTLDSSNPVRKRGKHREHPKEKRLTKIKHIILKERHRKRLCKEMLDQEMIKLLVKNKNNTAQHSEAEKSQPESCADQAFTSVDTGVQSSKFLNPTSCLDLKNDACETIDPDDLNSSIEKLANGASGPSDDRGKQLSSIKNISGPVGTPESVVKAVMHTKKFREYCENVKSKELDDAVIKLLKTLLGFQTRKYEVDPTRALWKRRLVVGIREVRKLLLLKKMRIIVCAPDLEDISEEGGLNDAVEMMKKEGLKQNIPVIFAANRRKLGYVTLRKVPVSVVGITNYEGAEDVHEDVIQKWQLAVGHYKERFNQLMAEMFPTQDLAEETTEALTTLNRNDDMIREINEHCLSLLRD